MEKNHVLLALSKHEGAGNDFLVMIDLEDRVHFSDDEVRQIADRRNGIGADGVITLLGPSGGGDLTMVLKNQDGSDAEISGNGLRCAAHEAVRSGLVAAGAFSILTGSGLRRVTCEIPEGNDAFTTAAMGEVVIEDLDVSQQRATVSVGNPHLIIIVDDLAIVDVERDGAKLQDTRDGGINVEWLAFDDSSHASMKVYERGVGPTLACGSGSVAAIGAARALSICGDEVEVANPGGVLGVRFHGDEAELSGTVTFVADVLIPFTRTS